MLMTALVFSHPPCVCFCNVSECYGVIWCNVLSCSHFSSSLFCLFLVISFTSSICHDAVCVCESYIGKPIGTRAVPQFTTGVAKPLTQIEPRKTEHHPPVGTP